jgi:hypothetical protein
MNANVNDRNGTRSIWRIMLWGGLAILLSLPALAMSLGAEGVDWSVSDFVIMGALLALVGLAIEAMMRFVRGWRERRIAIGAIVVVFLLVWAELAVGVFGTPFAGS